MGCQMCQKHIQVIYLNVRSKCLGHSWQYRPLFYCRHVVSSHYGLSGPYCASFCFNSISCSGSVPCTTFSQRVFSVARFGESDGRWFLVAVCFNFLPLNRPMKNPTIKSSNMKRVVTLKPMWPKSMLIQILWRKLISDTYLGALQIACSWILGQL